MRDFPRPWLLKLAQAEVHHNCKHGMKGTPTYVSWCAMRNRCNNPNAPDYHRYGGRGLRVCRRWDRFENFLADMGVRPPGLTLERKRNHQGYTPGNCVWATKKAQACNRRSARIITWDGVTLSLSEWAEREHVTRGAIWHRMRKYGRPDGSAA